MGHIPLVGRYPARPDDGAGEAKCVCRFKQGDDVPAWLIDFEPGSADSRPPQAVVFVCKGHVIEVGRYYWVLPDLHDNPDYQGACIAVIGGGDIQGFAPGDHHVVFVKSALWFVGASTDSDGGPMLDNWRSL